MCGIAGFHIKPEAKGRIQAGLLLDWLLKGIENRGREATGFVSVGFDNQLKMDKQPVTAMEFIQTRKSIPQMPQTILGHTRLATQGDPKFSENNHPVQYGTVFVTHNGWIVNDDELMKANDLERTAEVDTIALPAMLWMYNETGFNKAGIEYALEQCQGAVALAAIDVTTPGRVLLARGNTSPLVMIENKDIIIWASTHHAIQQAWGKVFGTPPAAKRFKVFQEGEYVLYHNGEVELEGRFTPTWVTRYTFGYSSWDEGDDDAWWTKAYADKNTETTSKGTWINMPDGSRTWIETEEEAQEAVANTPTRPSASDVETARQMGTWARLDAEAHEDTLFMLASDLQIPMTTVAWITLYADQQVLDANPAVKRVKEWIDAKYEKQYDTCLADLLTALDDPPAANTVEYKDCMDCGERKTPNGELCADCEAAYKRLELPKPEATEFGLVVEQINDTLSAPLQLVRVNDEAWLCQNCRENDVEDFADTLCGACLVQLNLGDPV